MALEKRCWAVLALAALTLCSSGASGGWTFSTAWHLPLSPDHEHPTTFRASVRFENASASINGSASNGTGTNGTGTNGTGTNGTGTNGTGTNGTGTNGTGTNGTGTNGTGTNGTGTNGTGTNGTGSDPTFNVTSCLLVIEPQDGRSTAPLSRLAMARTGDAADFELTLGPWPPGTEILYHFEAILSDGTYIRSNSSWVRTPDLLDIGWRHPLDAALELARNLARPVMAFVYSGYAQTTKWIDENLSRPDIVSLSAGFVCCRVVDEENPAFRPRFEDPKNGTDLDLPALLFLNGTTGKEIARIENPFDIGFVAAMMRHVLGRGERPAVEPVNWPQYRVEALALGATLVAGPVALYAFLRLRRRNK